MLEIKEIIDYFVFVSGLYVSVSPTTFDPCNYDVSFSSIAFSVATEKCVAHYRTVISCLVHVIVIRGGTINHYIYITAS